MSIDSDINRRDLIIKTAGIGAAGALAGTDISSAADGTKLPPGFADQEPLVENWSRQLNQIVDVDAKIREDAPDLKEEGGRERHRIYSYLLMKLIYRFWNGNKNGPLGRYPLRREQLDSAQSPEADRKLAGMEGREVPFRYRGDMIRDTGGVRVNWDRYLGHNIACIAVDGNGEIIDFEFNHNNFFRSSAEHAESRMVRRLFSLTDIFDNWKIGFDRCAIEQNSKSKSTNDQLTKFKPRPALLNEVTLYTSLESCAQCSGVMSLAGIKQIVFLQNDFTAYKIGNIMYMLANRTSGGVPGAPIPIAGLEIGLDEFKMLNDANLDFSREIRAAKEAKNLSGAFFVSENGEPDFEDSITSFLCTDVARKIFEDGGNKIDTVTLLHPEWKPPRRPNDDNYEAILTNDQCLAHAGEFYRYADIEGYRGSPHKL